MAHPKYPLEPIVPPNCCLPVKRISQKQMKLAEAAKFLNTTQEVAAYLLRRWTLEEAKAHLNPDPIEFTPCYPDGTRPKPPETVHTLLEAESKGLPGTYFMKEALLSKVKWGKVYTYSLPDIPAPEGYVAVRLYMRTRFIYPQNAEDFKLARMFNEMRKRGEDPAIDPFHVPKLGRPYGTTDVELGKAVMEEVVINGQVKEVKVKLTELDPSKKYRKESSSTLFQGPEDRAMKNRMRGYQ